MQEGQSLETHVSDKSILQHITELAEEEQRWCNQRCTRREFDDDPDTARPWDADMVDKHLQ